MNEETIIRTPIVDLKDVSIYQDNSLVLTDVNLQIYQKEFVYLIGKTGTGKSSLLKTLYGDLPLRSGSGVVVGFDLKKMTWRKVPQLRRKLGIVFQDFNLLTDRTVNDNLKFVLKATGWKDKNEMDLRVDYVLDKVGLKTKGFKKPFELSGGEQQRVVIARALLNDPELILADEPTGNLDPETSDDVIRLMRKLNSETGTPILMATHDYFTLEKFPGRIINCQNGKITESESIVM
jgi:cell division transport system ATP-binding protein